jgi:3-hydroxybutyryl-CoA dehydrogenase
VHELKEAKSIAVIGGGLMGSGIAQVAAMAEYPVILHDVTEELVTKAKQRIDAQLLRSVEKGKLSAEKAKAIIGRITATFHLKDVHGADAIIEAVPENLELKKKTFAELDQICQPDAILMTNTSCLPIAAIGSVTKRPDKVIGMHFFYPAPAMKLVELIRSVATSEETFTVASEMANKFGKHAVDAPDLPGFIVNRLFVPQANEAIYLVMEGVKPEDVDASLKLGLNHPMGPLELADFVGLDTLLFTMEGLYEGFGDSKYRPCPLLKRMVQSGRLGRKVGQGFYKYSK